MRWSNVFVIFRREVKDQVRDRRTLFMIFVLPILLYPMMGIGILQFSTAFEQKPRKVILVGPELLPDSPPLLNPERNGFDRSLFENDAEAKRLEVVVEEAKGNWINRSHQEKAVRGAGADAILQVPDDLRAKLSQVEAVQIPIVFDSTDEPSQFTYTRLRDVLATWKDKIVEARLAHDRRPLSYTEPIQIDPADVATAAEVGGSIWARLFPFLLVMMSLTGAFYPAVDLCAGEKERGTMETLLISPASRAEIVMGKFLTVVLASMMMALLNLVSMGITGLQMARQVSALAPTSHHRVDNIIAPPTVTAALWMFLLLIPLSAFFSALCLSLAVLARSMKEGQYYMTPLYMVCLPLIFLTLAPGIELNLFYSLVPITGVSLLLKALILGEYEVARRFFLPVLVPTILYGALALRWAIDQFQREDVLFREAERFSLKSWVRHLLRDKEPTPNGGEALLCFALMLTCAWFVIQYVNATRQIASPGALAASQVAFILTPPVAMAFLLTSDPRRTLRLYWPSGRFLVLGAALAIALNPLVSELAQLVKTLFPISKTMQDALEKLLSTKTSVGIAVLLFAFVPAICEEFAFRGFILTGLERGHRTRSAILLSALLFGFLHVLLSLFQQLFNATLLGLVLGLLAVRSGSIVPGIVFHFLNNSLAIVLGELSERPGARGLADWLYRDRPRNLYHVGWVVASVLVSAPLLYWLAKSPGPAGRKPAGSPE